MPWNVYVREITPALDVSIEIVSLVLIPSYHTLELWLLHSYAVCTFYSGNARYVRRDFKWQYFPITQVLLVANVKGVH